MRCGGPMCVAEVDGDRVCADCWAYRLTLLAALPALLRAARSYLPPSYQPRERVSGSTGAFSRPPLRNSVLESIESVQVALTGWADLVIRRARDRYPDVDHLVGSDKIVDALSTLDHVLADTSLAVDYYQNLWRAHRLLVKTTRIASTDSERIPGAACPACGRATLIIREFASFTACLTCGSTWCQSAWYALVTQRSTGVAVSDLGRGEM